MPSKLERYRPPRLVQQLATKETEHYRTSDWRAKRMRILVRDAFTCAVCRRVVSGRHNVDQGQRRVDAGYAEDQCRRDVEVNTAELRTIAQYRVGLDLAARLAHAEAIVSQQAAAIEAAADEIDSLRGVVATLTQQLADCKASCVET